jgi:hypothetical protein
MVQKEITASLSNNKWREQKRENKKKNKGKRI